jgi:hypothetical protein
MILFDFQLDEAVIRQELEMDVYATSAAALLHTHFEMPVRMRVGDVELLEMPVEGYEEIWLSEPNSHNLIPVQRKVQPSPWRSLPLLHISTIGLERLKEAYDQGLAVYFLPGGWELHFERKESTIAIYSTMNNRTGQSSYNDFIFAFEQFRLRVRETLTRETRLLIKYPNWGKWLSGEDEVGCPLTPNKP